MQVMQVYVCIFVHIGTCAYIYSARERAYRICHALNYV